MAKYFTNRNPIDPELKQGDLSSIPSTEQEMSDSFNQSAGFTNPNDIGDSDSFISNLESNNIISKEVQVEPSLTANIEDSLSRESPLALHNDKVEALAETMGTSPQAISDMVQGRTPANKDSRITGLRDEYNNITSSYEFRSYSNKARISIMDMMESNPAIAESMYKSLASENKPAIQHNHEGLLYAKALFELEMHNADLGAKKDEVANDLGLTEEELDDKLLRSSDNEDVSITVLRNDLKDLSNDDELQGAIEKAHSKYELSIENVASLDSSTPRLNKSGKRMTLAEIEAEEERLKQQMYGQQPSGAFDRLLSKTFSGIGAGIGYIWKKGTNKHDNFASQYDIKSQAVISASEKFTQEFGDFQSNLNKISSERGETPSETISLLNDPNAEPEILALRKSFDKVAATPNGANALSDLTTSMNDLEKMNAVLDINTHNGKFTHDEMGNMLDSMREVQAKSGAGQPIVDSDGKLSEANRKLSESMAEIGEKLSQFMSKAMDAISSLAR